MTTGSSHQQANSSSGTSASELPLWLSLLVPVWAVYVYIRFLQNHPWPIDGWAGMAKRVSLANFFPTLSGLLWIGSHIGWLVAIFFLAYVVGRRLLKLLKVSFPDRPMQSFLYAEALGFSVFMMLSFLLGILGLYRRSAVLAVGGLLLLATLPEILEAWRDSFRWIVGLRASVSEKRGVLLRLESQSVFIVILLMLLGILVVSLAPAIDWDSQNYHLQIPKRYVLAHSITPITFNLFSNMPHYMELLYVIGMLLQDYVLSKLIHGGFGILLLFLIYDFAKYRFSPRVASLALVIFFFNEDVISCFALSFVALALTFFYILSLDCLLRWLKLGEKRWLLLCGFFLGICLGLKLTVGLGVIPVTLVILWELFVTRRKQFRESLVLFFLFSAILLLPFLPWLIKNIVYVGNPLYPALYDVFGGKGMNPSLATRWTQYLDQGFGMPKTFSNYLLLPWNATIYGQRDFLLFGSVITPLWLIFLPFLLVVPNKRKLIRFLVLLLLTYYILWMFYIHYTRYTFPAFPLLSMLAAYTIDKLFFGPHPLFFRPLQKAMRALSVGLILLVAAPYFVSKLLTSTTSFLPVVLGNYNRQVFEYEYNSNHFIYDYINNELPQDSKIMFVWENRAFFSDLDVVADVNLLISHIFDMFSRFETTNEALERLKEMGITHVLVNTVLRAHLNEPFFTHPEEQERFEYAENLFEKLKDEHCALLFSSNGVELYEINAEHSSPREARVE
jgi:hypothetical protein